MFCKNCGKEVAAEAVACMGCGCDPRKGNKFCHNCGAEVNGNQIVCIKCGVALNASKGVKSSSSGNGEKSRIVAAVLALFLGYLGLHKFYIGKKKAGIIMLIVSVVGCILAFVPTCIMSIIALIEGVIYLMKSDEAFNDIYITGDKSWF